MVPPAGQGGSSIARWWLRCNELVDGPRPGRGLPGSASCPWGGVEAAVSAATFKSGVFLLKRAERGRSSEGSRAFAGFSRLGAGWAM